MTSWSGGYVADVEYIEGFYPQQMPARMALACLLGSVAMDMPGRDDPVHYLEIGCGRGMGSLLAAASNPAWQVTAIDYNPSHIATGRELARAAGLDNIRFIEADLVTLAGSSGADSIPDADFVSLHGVWTWVGPQVRAGIVRLLADKVKPGGAVHVSYNAMPAWQSALGMQRLIRENGIRTSGRSDRQALAGVAFAREIREAGGQYLNENALVRQLLDMAPELRPEYLSHEYMNEFWAPAFHADVAYAMAEAKLDWVASANPLENFPELMLTERQRALFERTDDPIMRELVKDTCLPRQFRQDVYVRGARRISNAQRDAAIGAWTLAPLVSASELTTTIDVPAGKAELGDELKAMMAALIDRQGTIRDTLAQAPGRSNPSELIGVMVGSQQGQMLAYPGAEQPASADRLNRVLGDRVRSLAGPQGSAGLASGKAGSGVPTAPAVQFIAGRLLAGDREDDLGSWVEMLGADLPPEKHETLRTVLQTALAQRVPILRQLGIVPH